MKKITTDTENIGLVSVGSYETIIGEHLARIEDEDDRLAAWNAVGNLAVEVMSYEFGDALRDLDDHFTMSFEHIWSPRFYNFETDAAIFTFEYDATLEEKMLSYANDQEFGAFLYKHYSSYSGFISFTPNNLTDWAAEARQGRSQAVSAWLQYVLYNACEGNNESIWYGFTEHAVEICEGRPSYRFEDDEEFEFNVA